MPLNCLIVATWLWFASLGGKGRRYVWNRRSYKFAGAILHGGIAEAFTWKTLSVVEYIPNKREFPSWRNFLVLFVGRYRVWKLRVITVRRFKTKDEAMEFARGKP